MSKFFLLALPAIFCYELVSGQAIIEKYWGGKGYDAAFSAAATTDGGYIMSGLTKSGADTEEGDILVIKTNAHADTMWTLQYGGAKLEGGNHVMQTADGGFLVSGHTEDFGARDCDAFMMKLDKAGTRQWLKVYGADLDDIAEGAVELPGEGYVFAGITENFGAGPDGRRNAWFVKTNTAGDTVWTRSYGGPHAEYAYSIVHQPGGGFLAVGFSNSWSTNGQDNAWLLRLKENGDTLSTSLYQTAGDSRFGKVLPLNDGGFILVGYTHTTLQDSVQGLVVKLDKDGKELWQKTYGSGAEGIAFYNAGQLPDGKLIFTGVSHKKDARGTAYVLTASASGDVLSDQYFGPGDSYANAVGVQTNGSYMIAGIAAGSEPAGDVYFAEIDASLARIPEAHELMPMTFPNPVRNTLSIVLPASLSNQPTMFTVTDICGRAMIMKAIEAGEDIITDCSALSKGLYLYQILSRDGRVFNGSFVVL